MSASHPDPPRTIQGLGHAIPILRVRDIDASLRYYTEVLGFAPEWRATGFAAVRREHASLMLCEGDQGHAGTWVWMSARDVDALYEELEVRGAQLRHPPSNCPWGSREIQVSDPDGHVLRFGSDLRAGEPMGEWLDGEGRRWRPQPDGSWRAAG